VEEGQSLKHRLGYEALLRALGRYCDKEQLDEIGLLEFDNGLVLQGLKVESTGEGYIRLMVTHTWSFEEIAGLIEQKGSSQG
jgi:hypothetical protein